jgi:uroporphyrinogen decarboxylase
MIREEDAVFLRACRREPVERTPIWIMRQAGRYLPEYRELRAKIDFLTSCRTPEIACEITLQPVRRLGVDAAILFSDILIPLPGMGVQVEFNPGPVIEKPVRTRADIEALRIPDAREATPFVMEAVRLIRRELIGSVPLIGFAGAPFTLATYLVEGGGSRSFAAIKSLLFSEPELAHRLLSVCADTTASYLTEQVRAGAQAAMLFDTWAGILSPPDYRAFALPYAQRVFEAVGAAGVSDGVGSSLPEAREGGPRPSRAETVPRIYYAGESAGYLDQVAAVGAEVIGLDWRVGLDVGRRRLGDDVAVQGNLDPAVLLGPPSLIESRVREVLRQARAGLAPRDVPARPGPGAGPGHAMGEQAVPDSGHAAASTPAPEVSWDPRPVGPAVGHVFNLGHGILPETPVENALFLVETVRRLSAA